MENILWKKEIHKPYFAALSSSIQVDVAIIGGGITGITAGYLLAKAGKRVAVLESMSVGGGTTGSSTGNLYALVDEMLHKIAWGFGEQTMKEVVASRTAAVEQIRKLVSEHGIDCDLQPCAWHLLAEQAQDNDIIKKEYEACVAAGLSAQLTETADVPFEISAALRVDGQAQFNPVKYMQQLAEKAQEAGCLIYEQTKVLEIEEGDVNTLQTLPGFTVEAAHVIHATHTTKGIMMIQTFLGPYREYALTAKLKSGNYPQGTFWTFNHPHHHSMRSYTDENGDQCLLVLGNPHKVGQKDDNQECLKALAQYVRERFDVAFFQHQWGAQHYKSADGLPYIGKASDANIYMATGFSTDGLVYGTLSAMILTDLILGQENQWAKIYDPSRHTPLQSAKRFIKENINVAGQYIKDIVFKPDVSELAEIGNDQAKMIEIDGEKYGAYRDKLGLIHIVSAVCTHMKCTVNWNSFERSWDCPCHGSRFNYDGKVIEGCAIRDLRTYSENSGEDFKIDAD